MIDAVHWLIASALLLSAPAAADPSPLQRADLMIRTTTTEAQSIEAPLAALIESAREVAATGGGRDPVLLFQRDADIIDRRADALSRKADHLARAIDDLAATLLEPAGG